jgi:hypothetical protein
MNREDTIRMVRKSAVELYGPMPDEKMYDIFIERCARLIHMGYEAGAAAEREECAKVCDELDATYAWDALAHECADLIRARGQ